MRPWPVEYYLQLIKKKNQIWLILHNRIIIPVERIFIDKITLAPGTLNQHRCIYRRMIIYI